MTAQEVPVTHVNRDAPVTIALAAAGLLGAFMQTLVTPLIPALPELLHTTTANAAWVLTATYLAAVISTPISGRLADMYGKRRVHLILLSALTIGAFISAMSFYLPTMIVGRILQGVGLGVIPIGMSILRDAVQARSLPGAIALLSATLGIGGAIGLPIAAWVSEVLDWHALFWFSGVVGAGLTVVILRIVPESPVRAGGRFDLLGAMGLTAGLVAVLLGISKGGEWGWSNWVTWAVSGCGVLIMFAWGLLELRVEHPLIDLRVSARRPILLTNLAAMAFGFGFFVLLGTLPVILQAPVGTEVGLGQTAFVSALCMVPLGMVMFLTTPVAAMLSRSKGPRFSIILGSCVVAIAFGVAGIQMDQIWKLIVVAAVVGLGVGIAYAAMPLMIMSSVPPAETASANGVNTVMRTLGSSISATMVGVVLSSQLDLDGVPSVVGFRIVFVVGAVVMAMGALSGAFLSRPR